jgi:hypothetical protein
MDPRGSEHRHVEDKTREAKPFLAHGVLSIIRARLLHSFAVRGGELLRRPSARSMDPTLDERRRHPGQSGLTSSLATHILKAEALIVGLRSAGDSRARCELPQGGWYRRRYTGAATTRLFDSFDCGRSLLDRDARSSVQRLSPPRTACSERDHVLRLNAAKA